MIDPAQFLEQFREEAGEHIRRLQSGLRRLVGHTEDGIPLPDLYRSAHTVKGAARVMGFVEIIPLAEAVEQVLDRLSKDGLLVTPEVQQALDSAVALLERMVALAGEVREFPGAATLIGQLHGLPLAPHGSTVRGGVAPASGRPQPPQRAPGAPPPPAATGSGAPAAGWDDLVEAAAALELAATLGLGQSARQAEPLPERARARAWRGLQRALQDWAEAGTAVARSVQRLDSLDLRQALERLAERARDETQIRERTVEVHVACPGTPNVERSTWVRVEPSLRAAVAAIVRHSVETPTERRALGKPTAATLEIRGMPGEGWVEIEVTDDGRGLRATGDDAAGPWPVTPHPSLLTLMDAADEAMAGVSLEVEEGFGSSLRVALSQPRLRPPLLPIRVGSRWLALPAVAVEPADCQPEEGRAEDGLHVWSGGAWVPAVEAAALLGASPATAVGRTARPSLVLRLGLQRIAVVVDEIGESGSLALLPLPGRVFNSRLSGLAIQPAGPALPVLRAHALAFAARAWTRRRQLRVAGQSLCVLLVEDSASMRAIERRMLDEAGYVVREATDGREALAVLAREEVQAVVTDLQLPGVDGLHLIGAIRGTIHLRDLPIIAVTSLEGTADLVRGLALGLTDYIGKSVLTQERLAAALARALA